MHAQRGVKKGSICLLFCGHSNMHHRTAALGEPLCTSWLQGSSLVRWRHCLRIPPPYIQSVVTTLDETEVHQPAQGVHAIEVAVGAPNSDSWCAVAVTAPRDVEYLWLKDASTATTRKVYGARYFAAQSSASPRQHPAVLQQQLKVGYRAKPFSYSKENGLYEGETFIVR